MASRSYRPPPKQMLVGPSRNDELRWVVSLDEIAGQMQCRGCHPHPGSGFFEEPDGHLVECTDCKGIGKVYVSL